MKRLLAAREIIPPLRSCAFRDDDSGPFITFLWPCFTSAMSGFHVIVIALRATVRAWCRALEQASAEGALFRVKPTTLSVPLRLGAFARTGAIFRASVRSFHQDGLTLLPRRRHSITARPAARPMAITVIMAQMTGTAKRATVRGVELARTVCFARYEMCGIETSFLSAVFTSTLGATNNRKPPRPIDLWSSREWRKWYDIVKHEGIIFQMRCILKGVICSLW